MFKKVSSGVLIIVLAVLMIAYLIVKYSKSDDRTFKNKVLTVDPESITQIIIDDPKSQQEPVTLWKTGDKWMVKVNNRDYTADTNVVKNMLKTLSDMPTKRFAGKGSEAIIKYEVADTSGTLVTLKSNDKKVAELLVGKFSYNIPKDQQQQMQGGRQPRGEMTSYVRIPDDKEVYAVDGYLKMTFSSKTDSYRYKSLSGVNPADINRITVREPGNAKVYENTTGKWTLNGAPADSAAMVRFRSTLARLSGSKFYETEGAPSVASHSVIIEGNNFSPVEIQAYPVADTNVNYVISSSANPGSYFNGKEGGLFKKIWPVE
jgi:hypothetical protein